MIKSRPLNLRNWSIVPLATTLLLTLLAAEGNGQGFGGSIQRGVDFLKSSGPGTRPGGAALAGLALLKAGLGANDPGVAAITQNVLGQVGDGTGYIPERNRGGRIYEAGVTIMFLATLDPERFKPQIQGVASYLIAEQKSNGAWDYPDRSGDTGDCSISQYALLGLWEAANAEIKIPPPVWERAAQWFLRVQRGGGWNYHPDKSTENTVSMTAAGVGSLLICQRQLAPYRRSVEKKKELSPLLTPLVAVQEEEEYRVRIPDGRIQSAIDRGLGWLGSNYRPANNAAFGPSTYYGLYGCERVGALADTETFGGINWFSTGAQYITTTQQSRGQWRDDYEAIPNTSWAILFLTRATKKTLERVEVDRLGAGTLLGGRGLPENLNNLTVAQGRVVVRPMNGAIEEMLASIEDPRAADPEAALAGLIEQYQKDGAEVFQPYIERFQILLESGTPAQRQTAAWALARAGDLSVAPDLINALEDRSDDVVGVARYGLRLLSRKIEGFGPPRGASREEKRDAARQWRDWYESVRPPELADQISNRSTRGR